jgi:hypothetical protein
MPEGVPLHDLLGTIAVDDGLEAVERPGAGFMIFKIFSAKN